MAKGQGNHSNFHSFLHPKNTNHTIASRCSKSKKVKYNILHNGVVPYRWHIAVVWKCDVGVVRENWGSRKGQYSITLELLLPVGRCLHILLSAYGVQQLEELYILPAGHTITTLARSYSILEVRLLRQVWSVRDTVQLINGAGNPEIVCNSSRKWPVYKHTMYFHDRLKPPLAIHHLGKKEKRWICLFMHAV